MSSIEQDLLYFSICVWALVVPLGILAILLKVEEKGKSERRDE